MSEEIESRNLRNLRNGIQHNGQTPAIQDAKRYLVSTQTMLKDAFSSAFDLDFENLRSWDFIQNNDLKRLVTESEDFLSKKKPAYCLIGCIFTINKVIGAIQNNTGCRISQYNYNNILNRSLKDILQNFGRFLTERFDNLETEILLVGMGMLIADTRRILSYEAISSDYQDNQIIRYRKGFTEETFQEDISEAKFMLEYIFKLLRFMEDNHPEILGEIVVKIPLSQQNFVKK